MISFDAWRFSAKLAWQDRFVRYVGLGTLFLIMAWSAFLLVRLVPEGVRSGVIVMHYNIYLGVDDVRAWPWIIALPAVMFAVYVLNTAIAAGIFRADALAARTLVALALGVTIIWGIATFFITLVNL